MAESKQRRREEGESQAPGRGECHAVDWDLVLCSYANAQTELRMHCHCNMLQEFECASMSTLLVCTGLYVC